MQIVIHKDFEQLQADTLERLQDTRFNTTQKGSVVMLLCNAINNNISNLYQYVEYKKNMAFLSTSEHEYIDAIGKLLNCNRRNMTDEEYKNAIANQTTILEKANQTSVEFSATIPDVDRVFIMKNAFGSGTFAIIPVGYYPVVSDEILHKIHSCVQDVVAEGTEFKVINPLLLETRITVKAIPKTLPIDKNALNLCFIQLKEEIKNSLNSMSPGDIYNFETVKPSLLYNSDISEVIHDLILLKLEVNGQDVTNSNYTVGWNQRIIEHKEIGAITIE